MMSRPLLVLSVVDAFSDHSDCRNILPDSGESSPNVADSQLDSESVSGSPYLQCNQSMGYVNSILFA